MIVTVTPNPSLDRTVQINHLSPGSVHRAGQVHLDPGGKGVNVARALVAADAPVTAVLPSGGTEGARLVELLVPESVPVAQVPVTTATRTNVAVVESDGTTSKFNESGPRLSAVEITALQDRAAELATDAEWVVTCGSVPEGCPDDLHARIVRAARGSGAATAVDTSGTELHQACLAGPDLVTPNLTELAQVAGSPLHDLGDVLRIAERLRAGGVGAVLVSLGALGAVLVDGTGSRHATCPPADVRSTVGAGDALLAGFLLGGGAGEQALRTAVAYGTAAVGLAGTRMPDPAHAHPERVQVRAVDETASLSGVAV